MSFPSEYDKIMKPRGDHKGAVLNLHNMSAEEDSTYPWNLYKICH